MTAAQALLADLRSRGIELESDGSRLRWRPAFLVTAAQEELIRSLRAELVGLLAGPTAWRSDACPQCGWSLDSARRCSKCCDRLCVDCGRVTGSYFVMRCVACGHACRG